MNIHEELTLNLPREVEIFDLDIYVMRDMLNALSPYLSVEGVVADEETNSIRGIIYTGNMRSPVNIKLMKEIKSKYKGTVLRKK